MNKVRQACMYGIVSFFIVLTVPSFLFAGSLEKKFNGTITDIHFSDPLKEPYFTLAEIDIVNQRGWEITVEVNQFTNIRDLAWRRLHVVALRKDKKIRVRYIKEDEDRLVAKEIFILEK